MFSRPTGSARLRGMKGNAAVLALQDAALQKVICDLFGEQRIAFGLFDHEIGQAAGQFFDAKAVQQQIFGRMAGKGHNAQFGCVLVACPGGGVLRPEIAQHHQPPFAPDDPQQQFFGIRVDPVQVFHDQQNLRGLAAFAQQVGQKIARANARDFGILLGEIRTCDRITEKIQKVGHPLGGIATENLDVAPELVRRRFLRFAGGDAKRGPYHLDEGMKGADIARLLAVAA